LSPIASIADNSFISSIQLVSYFVTRWWVGHLRSQLFFNALSFKSICHFREERCYGTSSNSTSNYSTLT